MAPRDLPTYSDLMLPVLRAVASLGGSAQAKEITAQVVEDCGLSDDDLAIVYDNNDKSVVVDRIAWARSYNKLGGALDSPRRGLFLLSTTGKDVLALPEEQALEALADMDRRVRTEKRKRPKRATSPGAAEATEEGDPEAEDDDWKTVLLRRLHRLTPEGFEEFVMALLRVYGLELERVGGTGDEGIDGIGTAPLSDVLSSRVAVQAKRHDPESTLSRDVVALFQRDASAAGAERAVLVTLGRFSRPARNAAIASRPTVDLIDGDRLCELAEQEGVGVRLAPRVDESWFDRFD